MAEAFQGGNQSLTANGWQRLPGGLILQWVTVTVSSGGGQSVPLPITFPNATLFVGAGQVTEATGDYYFSQVVASTTSAFTVAVYGNAAGAAPVAVNGLSVKYFAVGY
ncbi:hypothetical protein D3C86_1685970 [compost metagenome]